MTPAFIVEGKAEQKIIQKICPGSKVIILECNGSHVKMAAIAKRVASFFRIFGNRHYPISLIFDREKREATCDEIRKDLETELKAHGVDPKQFRIGIADRKLEAWILYAVNSLGNFNANCSGSQKNEFEGANADYELILRLKKRSIDYHKTTTAVDLFSRINAKSLGEKSESFHSFLKQIDFQCRWVGVA